MNRFKKKILIDLDGVLNKYGNEPFNENFIPPINDGAKEFLKSVSEYADLYLFTSRNLMLSAKWLIENQIDKYFIDVTNIKLPSFLYVDDRCICFNGDYTELRNQIKNFKVWYKK